MLGKNWSYDLAPFSCIAKSHYFLIKMAFCQTSLAFILNYHAKIAILGRINFEKG